ncbi:hypothetical protein F5144DRAFT_506286 [Chaetomium tenue]|uniref:Uncharacterized protein n=1 Tax=Chaetomium tenue TaxID=1854479 RepID=A0ACB7PJJ0_9PEZI|nr:hypothetical protein F5144DRAFT_506286 [Chaetomium globosum]
MSGFEIAGVVLGAIPLVISALENYRSGKGAARAFLKWRGDLNILISRLKRQHMLFSFDTRKLLVVANVDDPDGRVDYTEMECVELLSKKGTENKIRSFLATFYGLFLDTLKAYESCLKRIVRKIRHIQRLPDAEKDDLKALLLANPGASGGFAFQERISFTLDRGSLKELLEELKEERLSLSYVITEQAKYAPREASRQALKIVRRLGQVQSMALSLYPTLSRTCTCRGRTKRTAMTRLDSRLLTQEEEGCTTFGLMLQLTAAGERTFLQQASVSMVQKEEYSDQPTVRFKLIATKPTISQPGTEIRDLCQITRGAVQKGSHLGLQVVVGKRRLSLFHVDSAIIAMQRPSIPESLDQILARGLQDETVRLTPKQQTILALNVASSVLQFRQTNWLTAPWSSKSIKLVPASTGAFVEAELQPPGLQPPALSDPDPLSALLEVAILLLEIWNHKPLEAWAASANREIMTPDHRKIAATVWLQETTHRILPDYLDAIEKCLAICAGRKWGWDDGEFQKRYCENVIKPLADSCKVWGA